MIPRCTHHRRSLDSPGTDTMWIVDSLVVNQRDFPWVFLFINESTVMKKLESLYSPVKNTLASCLGTRVASQIYSTKFEIVSRVPCIVSGDQEKLIDENLSDFKNSHYNVPLRW
jgi:hypothetical protein